MKKKSPSLSRVTPRLILRSLNEHDYENWVQSYSCQRPPQTEWDETNWKKSELTKAKFKALLKRLRSLEKADHSYHFGVFRKDDGVLMGSILLMDISRDIFQNAYFGYRIYNNYWGQGYATEACRAVMSIAFKDLKLHRLEAGIQPHNKVSIKVAKKLNLRKESLSVRRLYVKKKWSDVLLYAMTAEEFKKSR